MKTCRGRLGMLWAMILGTAMARGVEGMTSAGSEMIWDKAPHHAFTDLHRQRRRWYCTVREGAVRTLVADDGPAPASARRLTPSGPGVRATIA